MVKGLTNMVHSSRWSKFECNKSTFKDINTTNILAINGASPTVDGGTFEVGIDEQGYHGSAIQAYGAGAGSVVMQILNADFTGEEESDCGSQGGGRSAIYLEDSYVKMDKSTYLKIHMEHF